MKLQALKSVLFYQLGKSIWLILIESQLKINKMC